MLLGKGRQALFFVTGFVGLAILAASLWGFYPRSPSSKTLPTLWIFYARTAGRGEILYARNYSARGQPMGAPLRLGRLGLVAENEVAFPGTHGWEWVTTGGAVLGIRSGRVRDRLPAPPKTTILCIADISGALDGVVESRAGNHIAVDRWDGRSWRTLATSLPVGITTLEEGLQGSLWALIADPTQVWLKEVRPRSELVHVARVEPQGTVGFSWRGPVLPYTRGLKAFGYWRDGLHRFGSVYQAAVSVTDTEPLWGVGVAGMIPFAAGQFQNPRTVRWPHRQITTPEVLNGGNSAWVAVLDGFSQGTWFNVRTGRFGPDFQIKTPWWAVVRAASLGS